MFGLPYPSPFINESTMTKPILLSARYETPPQTSAPPPVRSTANQGLDRGNDDHVIRPSHNLTQAARFIACYPAPPPLAKASRTSPTFRATPRISMARMTSHQPTSPCRWGRCSHRNPTDPPSTGRGGCHAWAAPPNTPTSEIFNLYCFWIALEDRWMYKEIPLIANKNYMRSSCYIPKVYGDFDIRWANLITPYQKTVKARNISKDAPSVTLLSATIPTSQPPPPFVFISWFWLINERSVDYESETCDNPTFVWM